MNSNDIFLMYMLNNFNLKYNIFDKEDDEFEETNKITYEILLTEDYNFIGFCMFYFFLYEERLKNALDKRHIITSEDMWPQINYSQTVIKNYLKTKNDKEYKQMIKFLNKDFKAKLDEYVEILLKENKLIKDKISPEKKSLINSMYRKEILAFHDNKKFGIYLNEIASIINQINVLKNEKIQLDELYKDEKRYKFNFCLSVSLAVVSILISIVSLIV